MTTQIDKLEAGPELDALVAERVMGQSMPAGYEKATDGRWTYWEPERYDDGSFSRSVIEQRWPPYYSTNIADAWKVVERFPIVSLGRGYFNYSGGSPIASDIPQYTAMINRRAPSDPTLELEFVQAKTAPLAICLAALKAVLDPG